MIQKSIYSLFHFVLILQTINTSKSLEIHIFLLPSFFTCLYFVFVFVNFLFFFFLSSLDFQYTVIYIFLHISNISTVYSGISVQTDWQHTSSSICLNIDALSSLHLLIPQQNHEFHMYMA